MAVEHEIWKGQQCWTLARHVIITHHTQPQHRFSIAPVVLVVTMITILYSTSITYDETAAGLLKLILHVRLASVVQRLRLLQLYRQLLLSLPLGVTGTGGNMGAESNTSFI